MKVRLARRHSLAVEMTDGSHGYGYSQKTRAGGPPLYHLESANELELCESDWVEWNLQYSQSDSSILVFLRGIPVANGFVAVQYLRQYFRIG